MDAPASAGPSPKEVFPMFCPRCGVAEPREHRFCPACGTQPPVELLQSGRPKTTRWFRGVPVVTSDPPDAALRVSRYLEEFEMQAPEGSVLVPSHHVRFSIWVGDEATCALSIPD